MSYKQNRINAQIFSLDMIIALGIFIVILLASASAWDNAQERIYLAEQRNDLEFVARNAMSSLVLTSGNPADWNNLDKADFSEVNVRSIGLVNSTTYSLHKDKIQYLTDPGIYAQTKRILGIIGPNYEFLLEIKGYDGVQFTESNLIGLAPDAAASEIVVVERSAAYGSKWAVVRLKVWKGG